MPTKKLKRGDVVRLITSRPAYGATFRDWQTGRPKDRTKRGVKLTVIATWRYSAGPADAVLVEYGSSTQVLHRSDVQFVRRPKGVRQGNCQAVASTTTTHGVTNG